MFHILSPPNAFGHQKMSVKWFLKYTRDVPIIEKKNYVMFRQVLICFFLILRC